MASTITSYLRSTNKAHIDTGISQLTVGKFEIMFCAVNYRYDGGTDWQKIAGGRSSHNVNNALSVYYNFSNKWVGAAIGGTFVDALFSNINVGEWHIISWDYSTQKVSLDGQEASTTFPIPTGTSYNFFLFATDGQQSQEFPGKIAYCKLWDKSGNLIFDGTPYRKNFSVGMMDSVSGDVFYGDTVYSSPGDLVYGEMQPSSGLRYYDYLIGDGLSYIDTGIDVSGASFGIDGTFIRLRDASNEDTIISNFTGALGYFSVFISAYHSQRIDLYLREHVLVGDSVPAIGREVPISLSWDNDIYTISTIGTTISATQANAQTNTVRILARGENIGSYPCPVMAIKGPWTISKGGVIVRSLRPCSYNGVAGMYDSVNDVFYPSANTVGEFALADSESRVVSINHLSLGDFRRRLMNSLINQDAWVDDGKIHGFLTVPSTGTYRIFRASGAAGAGNFSAVYIDGVSSSTTSRDVTLTEGDHEITFVPRDNRIGEIFRETNNYWTKVCIPGIITSLGDASLGYNKNWVVTPKLIMDKSRIVSIGSNTFRQGKWNMGEDGINFPNLETMGNYPFYDFVSRVPVTSLGKVTSIGSQCFYNANIRYYNIPDTVTACGYRCFMRDDYNITFVINAVTPPTYDQCIWRTPLAIYVPSSSVQAYKEASGWSSWANKIQAIP